MRTLEETHGKYSFKVDDLLVSLLNDYHKVDASEIVSFFGERAMEMLETKPNINKNSRKPQTVFMRERTTKIPNNRNNLRKMDMEDGTRVYVLRGFYPETHVPFKMTLVKDAQMPTAFGKVTIGNKEHYTKFTEIDITKYNNHVSEAILLGKEVEESEKVEYQYRDYKLMRPRGMQLYRKLDE